MKLATAIKQTADIAQDLLVILICSSVIASLALLAVAIHVSPETVLSVFQ